MATLVENFQSGTISDNPLTNVATSVTSTAFASLPVVSAPDVMKLVLDPEGVAGDPEIVTVTAHTSSSTSVTVTRGSNNRQHSISTKWVMAATKAEWDSVLAAVTYVPPVGSMMPYAGTTSPDTNVWLLCDGAAVSRTTYASLFSLTSTTFGNGDGSTTFNVPDMRGRVPLGLDNLGGSSADRVVDASADALAGSLGAETHTLTTAEMPAHTHTGPSHRHTGADHSHTGPSHRHTGPSHTHSFSDTSSSTSVSHTHSITHNHASFNTASSGSHKHAGKESGFMVLSDPLNAGSNGAAGNDYKVYTHTETDGAHVHPIDVPSYSGTSGAATSTSHSHSVSGTTGTGGTGNTGYDGTGNTGNSGTGVGGYEGTGATGSTGSGTAHNLMQPSLALGYLIRAA